MAEEIAFAELDASNGIAVAHGRSPHTHSHGDRRNSV